MANAPVDPLPAEMQPDVQQGLVIPTKAPPPAKPAALEKRYPSARCALVGSAFQQATSGAVRKQLKRGGPLALVLLVPGATWIEPVRTLFAEHFGAPSEVIATDAWNNTPKHKAQRAVEVATDLARGRPVVGVAARLDALPSVLTTGADLTIQISAPNSATLRRAIRMFTGKPPGGIDETIGAGLDFPDEIGRILTRVMTTGDDDDCGSEDES